MSLGPVEYVILGFPGNQFKGEIAPALAALIEAGTVRVLDLVFIYKDADGSVAVFEYDALAELTPFAELDGEAGGLLNDDDIDIAADAIPPNSSAALLVWEDTWATPLVEALRNAGGVLIDGARIPHEIAVAAFEGLPAAG